jgi:hypothetical protein
MSQTASSLALVLRERWDSNTIAKQWFVDDGPLSRIESIEGTPIGKQLQVGIWGDVNAGGYTSTSVAGGALNTASNAAVDQAIYTLTQHFFPISLEFSALNQASGDSLQSLIGGKNLEITNALASLRNQCTRQLVTNGDGKVAACDTSGGSVVVPLIASPSGTAYGFDAIQRNWLRPGAVVDIGTTADTDVLVTATTVSAVAESATAPTITVGTSITTANGTHFVYIANPNSATAANPELNGLRNMVNTTGALGGVNPGVAGEEFWQAAARDTTTTVLSLDLLLNLQGKVQQKSGKVMTDCWTGIKQGNNFYALLQNQVRFPGEAKMGAGGVSSVTWNNMEVTKWPAILDSDWYALTLSDFCRVTGSITKPTWMSQVGGDGGIGGVWNTGNTNFVDALAYAFQVGLRRRNTHAAATGLTA